MLKVILIDDEKRQSDCLITILHRYAPALQIVAICTRYEEGIEKIKECNPNLVFIDVYLRGKSAFRLLDEIGNRNFNVIFVTGALYFDGLAAQYNPIGYLFKPIEDDELCSIIDQLIEI